MATLMYGVNTDTFYVAGRPKADDCGLMKVLETVGNTLADEKGFPKPGSRVEVSEKVMEVVGCPMYSGIDSYLEIAENAERLKKGAGMGGLWVDFEFNDGKTESIVKTEVIERKKLPRLAEEVTKSHYFKVNGYVSHKQPLPKNIDLIENEDNLAKVKTAIGENGREKTLYSLLDGFMSYSPDPRIQSNTEKVFGLGDDKLYTGLKGLLKEEVRQKHDEVESSRLVGLPIVGSKYREHRIGQIEKHRAKREKQIDTLRERFSEPYKSAVLHN